MIQQHINDLASRISDWCAGQIQEAYNQGQSDAIAELQSFEDEHSDAAAAAIIAGSVVLDQLHRDAAQALAQELQIRLSDAITQMARSADKTLGQILRESIRSKIASVDESTTAKALRKSILSAFDENGVYALLDRAGRRWSPGVYAEMVSRTMLTQARNTGMTNSLSGAGYDLVQVSSHGASDLCREWEGAILSVDGTTPGFFTVSDAAGGGLFHVNCQHSLDPVSPSDFPNGYWAEAES
ncbi:phage minor capsid protein [Cryobacterium sp. GrIS_2_6]|uniref:phage minor capsid protein n=1 Tax=Cryobacterium sp. GrIS_2_6 TaxID=3162785 RepID=UPI002DF99969|nr:phage minor capsid protein [Cryobacterium psychrotolerans]MEC5150878.1 hypothetical protein [Cryobacterium psychrotolerans]